MHIGMAEIRPEYIFRSWRLGWKAKIRHTMLPSSPAFQFLGRDLDHAVYRLYD